MATGSVDRLDEIPLRLRFLFEFDPRASLARAEVREVLAHAGAREVIDVLARELAGAGRLDRETFRAVIAAIRQQTGQKGRGLFHPVRVALTGEAAGPELDLAVPAIDRGAGLPSTSGVARIVGCRERAAAFARVPTETGDE